MSPTKTSAFYRRISQLYCKIRLNETNNKQMAQLRYIWSKLGNDTKKIKTVIQIFNNESKFLAR